MKVLLALCYEEGDAADDIGLTLPDGSTLTLGPGRSQAHVELERFQPTDQKGAGDDALPAPRTKGPAR